MEMDNRQLFQVGFNHLLAPVAARERAAVAQAELGPVLKSIAQEIGVEELALVSTCSRLELYGVSVDPTQVVERARQWFSARAGGSLDGYIVDRLGRCALSHLFRVAAGLDSWILGETEILGQVRRAYEAARLSGFTRATLNRVFQSAVAAGKSARAKSGIQGGIHSIGGAAAVLAKSIFGQARDGTTVVFGAGEAAEATALHLAAKNFSRLYVANRTLERAGVLAAKIGGQAIGIAQGIELLATAEIAVFSTACESQLLSAAQLRRLVARRRRPLFLVDIGLPRNVDPACADLEGVYLYDLDDLKAVVARSIEGKAQQKDQAEAIVSAAVESCGMELEKAAARRTAPQGVTA